MSNLLPTRADYPVYRLPGTCPPPHTTPPPFPTTLYLPCVTLLPTVTPHIACVVTLLNVVGYYDAQLAVGALPAFTFASDVGCGFVPGDYVYYNIYGCLVVTFVRGVDDMRCCCVVVQPTVYLG